jgi:PKD repeat protein
MSDIIYVSTTEELYDALATCTGGETILLEGGEYGDLSLWSGSGFAVIFPENVTIASADPDNPAIFDTLEIHDAANITIDGLYFDYTFSEGDESWYRPFEINDSSNITVVNCTFDGDVAAGVDDVADGYGWAYGLSVRNCDTITIENSEFFDFYTGIIVSETDNINVIGNDVHSVRVDGMNFVEVTNVVIAENYIHDFAGNPESDDHCDMIQFWTNGTDSPSTDIVIENNVLDIGDGTPAQSIFMRNEEVDTGAAGEEMYYQNVTITGNVIVNGHLHGIAVGETDGLLIENNTVVHADGGDDDGLDEAVEIPAIYVAEDSTNVTISQNVTGGVNGDIGQEDWTVTDNVIVQDQDPNGENYYGDVFITSTLAPEDGLHTYVAVPGGVIEQAGAGATSTLSPEIDGVIEAHFQIVATPDNAAVRHFDAGLTLTSLESLPEGTTYTWDFGDGTTATGIQVSHAFPDGGVYPVTLTVALPDGTSDSQSFDVGIQGPTLVSFENGQFTAFDQDAQSVVATVDGVIEVPETGGGLIINRQHFREIEGADDIEVNLTIVGDSAQNAGEILRLHMSFYMTVQEDGELRVTIHNPEGVQFDITTTGAGLNDTDLHDIRVHLSGDNLEIIVDEQVVGSGEVTGGMGYSGSHDLTFGNPWGSANYDGSVSALEITANADDFEGPAVLPGDPLAEEPVAGPVVEEPVAEEPVVEEPNAEEPVAEEPVIEEPVVEEPVVEEPVIEEPVIEEPVLEETVVEEPVAEEPVVEDPVAEEPEPHGNGNGNASMMARIFEFLKSLLGFQSTIRAEVDGMEATDTSEADKLALDEDEQVSDPESMAA